MTTDQNAEEQLAGSMGESETEQVQEDIAALRSGLADLEQRARTLISEQPVVAVLAAVGVGYVLARLVSRGTR